MTSRKRIHGGKKIVIEAVASDSGDSQPVQFLRELMDDKKTKAWVARFHVSFKKLCDEGHIQNPDRFKKLNDIVWEFRAGADRLLGGYLPGGIFLLISGFRKKSQKTPKAKLKAAEEAIQKERKNEEGGDDE